MTHSLLPLKLSFYNKAHYTSSSAFSSSIHCWFLQRLKAGRQISTWKAEAFCFDTCAQKPVKCCLLGAHHILYEGRKIISLRCNTKEWWWCVPDVAAGTISSHRIYLGCAGWIGKLNVLNSENVNDGDKNLKQSRVTLFIASWRHLNRRTKYTIYLRVFFWFNNIGRMCIGVHVGPGGGVATS